MSYSLAMISRYQLSACMHLDQRNIGLKIILNASLLSCALCNPATCNIVTACMHMHTHTHTHTYIYTMAAPDIAPARGQQFPDWGWGVRLKFSIIYSKVLGNHALFSDGGGGKLLPTEGLNIPRSSSVNDAAPVHKRNRFECSGKVI
jgi:hypothetical protein